MLSFISKNALSINWHSSEQDMDNAENNYWKIRLYAENNYVS